MRDGGTKSQILTRLITDELNHIVPLVLWLLNEFSITFVNRVIASDLKGQNPKAQSYNLKSVVLRLFLARATEGTSL